MALFDLVTPEITNHCNYSCYTCPNKDLNRSRGFMDLDLFKRIYTECKSISREICIAFFGEPTLHPNFIDLLDFISKDKGDVFLSINTNLSCATIEIFEKLINTPFDQVRFSVDAASPEVYSTVRPASYTLDLYGKRFDGNDLKLIDDKIKYWHSLKNHVSTRHVYTVSSKNIDDLKKYLEKWGPCLGPNDEIIAKRVLTYSGKIYDSLVKEHPCNVWDHNFAVIDWEGNVSPCNLDTNLELNVGSVKDKSLNELLASSAWSKFREKSKSKSCSPCNKCLDSNAWSSDRCFVYRQGDSADKISSLNFK